MNRSLSPDREINTSEQKRAEGEIRALMDAWVKAARARDVAALMRVHASDVTVFDVVNPLRYLGATVTRKRLEEWFASFSGPIGYELHDLTISAASDVAFCHSLNHVNGTKTDGTTLDMWWRATVCFSKRDSKWVVTHAHSSVPFDVSTGRASLDLKP
jgi:ketosteroid isomerase-like protein